MPLIAHYEAQVRKGQIIDSQSQRDVLIHFEQLLAQLSNKKKSIWKRWLFKPKTKVQGLYLYGSVGAGKTFLMDLFYEAVSVQKKRFHFLHFMQQVDALLRRFQGRKNPLKIIASLLCEKAQVLCFDEMIIEDIADALMLVDLLGCLIQKGIVLVITSNQMPDDLYDNGVHRERFLKAIDLIKNHCTVVKLDEMDHRLNVIDLKKNWLYPFTQETAAILEMQFKAIPSREILISALVVQSRTIPCIACKETAVWFDFSVICHSPRSQLDYIEIADRFDVILISHIPFLGTGEGFDAILFMYLVDIMYDRGVILIATATDAIDALYAPSRHPECERIISRLFEMQSAAYEGRQKRLISLLTR